MNENRYIRQTLLSEIGIEGQKKLHDAHVVIVGCGGLGSIAAPYLAGSGVGRLTLVDGDRVDVTNLHRQVTYSEESTGYKSEELAKHIIKLNSTIIVKAIPSMITKANIYDIIKNATLVLECTDNILTKYLVNDFCHLNRIPLCYGAIHKYEGYLSFFQNDNGDCIHLRDIFPEPNEDIPSCSEVGVMGALAGIVGILQASEAIKYITGAGMKLCNQLLTFDILTNEMLKLKLKKAYTEDLQSIFDRSDYISENLCRSYELTAKQLQEQREKYQLISILEEGEHISIDADTIWQPLSKTSKYRSDDSISKPTVYYCMSGKRSGNLVEELLRYNSNLDILSLKGGVREWQKSTTEKLPLSK